MSAELIRLWELLPKRAQAVAPEVSPLDWPELEAALPDGGLPKGVVELTAPRALGGATSIALSAVRAAQQRDPEAYCAWVDPEGTLYAPGVAMAGVDLARLLVVRPPRERMGDVALRLASAHAFEVVLVDTAGLPGALKRPQRVSRKKSWPMEVLVRKLALQASQSGATVVLLSDASAPRELPWPVALRLEVGRRREGIAVRVAKDKHGRTSPEQLIPPRQVV